MASSENSEEIEEEIEKVRQEIMRFKELLGVMRGNLEEGERAYARLFASFSPDEMAGTKEKDLQWKLAQRVLGDLSPLSRAAVQMRFHAHNLERAFEELYDIIVSGQKTD